MAKKLDFLVMGAGRGGTSLLTTCIDAHPDVEAGLEMFTSQYLRGWAINDARQRYDMPFRISKFLDTCKNYSKKSEKRLYGNKILVENIYWLQDCLNTMQQDPQLLISYFFSSLPKDLKIVFIVRDGRNILASKVERTGQPYSLALFRYEFFIMVLRFLKKNYEPLLVVKFEDLVSEPESVILKVCDFLDIDFNPAMLTTQGSSMPSYYEKSYFDKSKANIKEIPEKYHQLIQDDLTYCGYS